MKTQLRIQMLGSSFSIQSEQSPEHLEVVLRAWQKKIDEVLDKNAGTEPLKIALLAGLNLADEVVRLRQSMVADRSAPGRPPLAAGEEIESIASHLIQKIDDALLPPDPAPSAQKPE